MMSETAARPLVIHADDLGLSLAFNEGIRVAATQGSLTSTCVRVNGAAFREALLEVVPQFSGIGIGIHLNLVEGRTTRRAVPRSSALCGPNGDYRASFPMLLRRQRDVALLAEIERDCRDQIETALRHLPDADHLNSHQHSHAVPALFEVVCRLANEYGIPYVRLPRERFYHVPDVRYHLGAWYPANLGKVAILNGLARRNLHTAEQRGIRTNAWLVGIAYTGYMRPDTIRQGLAALRGTQGQTELLLHPCRLPLGGHDRFLDSAVRDYVLSPARAVELAALLDASLAEDCRAAGWLPTHYGRLARGHDANAR